MKRSLKLSTALLAVLVAGIAAVTAQAPGINNIDTVVVIYAENRSFDNLY